MHGDRPSERGKERGEAAQIPLSMWESLGEPSPSAEITAPGTYIPGMDRGSATEDVPELSAPTRYDGAVIDFAKDGFRRLLWAGADVAASMTPLGTLGSLGVKTVYFLKEQLYASVKSMLHGDGFILAVAIPTMQFGPVAFPPPGFQLAAQVTVGDQRTGPISDPQLKGSIEFFKPFSDPFDAGQPDRLHTRPDGIPAATEPPQPDEDPFAVFLALMGDALIHHLAAALALGASVRFEDLDEELRRRALR